MLAIIICLGARSIVIMHRKCIKRRALPAWVQPSRACIEQYSIAAGKTYLYLKSCLKYSCLVQYNDNNNNNSNNNSHLRMSLVRSVARAFMGREAR